MLILSLSLYVCHVDVREEPLPQSLANDLAEAAEAVGNCHLWPLSLLAHLATMIFSGVSLRGDGADDDDNDDDDGDDSPVDGNDGAYRPGPPPRPPTRGMLFAFLLACSTHIHARGMGAGPEGGQKEMREGQAQSPKAPAPV